MVTQRNDETNPGVCPPLPLIGLRLGRSLKRLGVDRRHRDDAAFGRFRQDISGGRGRPIGPPRRGACRDISHATFEENR